MKRLVFLLLGAAAACSARTPIDLPLGDPDAARDAPVDPGCPSEPPSDRSPCSVAATCTYPGRCGRTVSTCTSTGWFSTKSACTCPSTQPTNGTTCTVNRGTTCTWPSTCGATTGSCDAGDLWQIVVTPCPPPPPPTPTCPESRPAFGAACDGEGLTCTWPNLCGTTDVGTCAGGAWKLDIKACGDCPLFTPVAGRACTGDAACVYYIPETEVHPGGCKTPCACTSGVWSCGACT